MNELEELRSTIDQLDSEIALLYAKRLEIVKQIGDYKRENNINVLDEGREQKVITNITDCLAKNQKSEYENDIIQLYRYIMDYSKRKQERK